MRILRIAGEGVNSLTGDKLRTFFMMAGTIVGIAALTVIMAIGKGTEKRVMKRVESFGPRAMMVVAGGGKTIGPPDSSVTTLTLADARAIRDEIPDLEFVIPQAWHSAATVKRDANQIQTTLWGVEPQWHDAWNWYAATGDGIADEDVAPMARVCVIGSSVKRDLFGQADAIGESLYIDKVSLTVKGVLEPRGTSGTGGGDFDNRIIIPITTAMRRVLNADYIGGVRIVTKDAALMGQQSEQIVRLLRDRHHITPPAEDDFRINTPTAIADVARGTSRTLSMLLTALASLSLLVGGVVLMNVLLISVAERTKEIGLRRAVGATQRDIFAQFLMESLSVTFLGMVLGSLLGLGVSLALGRLTPLAWIPTVQVMPNKSGHEGGGC